MNEPKFDDDQSYAALAVKYRLEVIEATKECMLSPEKQVLYVCVRVCVRVCVCVYEYMYVCVCVCVHMLEGIEGTKECRLCMLSPEKQVRNPKPHVCVCVCVCVIHTRFTHTHTHTGAGVGEGGKDSGAQGTAAESRGTQHGFDLVVLDGPPGNVLLMCC